MIKTINFKIVLNESVKQSKGLKSLDIKDKTTGTSGLS